MSKERRNQETLLQLRRTIRLLPLIAIIYCSSSGGAYGLETTLSTSGAGITLILILVMPLVLSIPMSLMSAELGSALPLEGGYYAWVKIAMGRFAGFMEAMFSWLASWLDTALYPVIFVDYLSIWFPGLARGKHPLISLWDGGFSIDLHWLVAILMMIPLAYLNIRGADVVGRATILFVIGIFVPMLCLIFFEAKHFITHPHSHLLQPMTLPHQSIFASLGAGLGIMIWSYIGYDQITTASSEIRKPSTIYPKALLINVPLIVIGYLLPILAALATGYHSSDITAWQNGDFANAGGVAGGTWLRNALILGALLGQIGLFSSLLLCVSRLPLVLAADSYLPAGLARLTDRAKSPAASIITSVSIFAVFAALNFTTLIDSDSILTLFGLMLEFAALIILRKQYPLMKRPFKIKYGWFGVIGVTVGPSVLTIWLLWNSLTQEPLAFWIGIGLSAGAALSYPLLKKYVKKGNPDAVLDLSEVDFGPGLDQIKIFSTK